jgi:NADH-quinone oxidoreductase subunit L
MTFHGDKRWPKAAHPHESPQIMTVPMMVLAAGSALLGLILSFGGMFTTWLNPAVGGEVDEHHPVLPAAVIMGLTLLLVLAGAALAFVRYVREPVPTTAPAGSLLTQAARNDLYQDEVNEGLFMRPGIHLTRALDFVDRRGVDGAAGGLAALIGGTSARVRRLQNGLARSYALTMLLGVVVILGAVWVIQ